MNRFELICKANKAGLSGDFQDITNELNNMFSDGSYKENIDLVYEIIASFQLYGFLSYFSSEEKNRFLNTDIWRSNIYKGVQLDFLNRGQLSVVEEIDRNKKTMLSAPTSFGKTTLILEYVLKKYEKINTIIFILPTNSLTEELYIKLLTFNSTYKLNYEISNQPGLIDGRKVFLLTPERFLMMCQIEKNTLYKTDLIVMDEMYKIRKGEGYDDRDFLNNRSMRFRKVADLVGKSDSKVVYLSPFTYNDTESMKAFLDKYSICKINRTMEYVKKNIVDGSIHTNKNSSDERAVDLIYRLKDEKNIVYVNARDVASKIVKKYKNNAELPQSERLNRFYEHIKNNYLIEEYEWDVAEAIRKGVGIYISPMPRYIKKEIINLYEQNYLSTIIVTTAFTEGVNCNARNLILTSLYTGKNVKLTQIDMLNIIGRVGRFASESVGTVYCINSNIYDKVIELIDNDGCLLENDNYRVSEEDRSDFEIDMIESQYLKEEEKQRKEKIISEQQKLGLSNSDLNISLSVSKKWKIVLYRYFKENMNQQEVKIRKKLMKDILNAENEGHFIEAISFFFFDLKKAFESAGINSKEAFPQRNGGIPVFDKKGEFVWGRLYGNYVLGDVKGSILKNIKYIKTRYEKVKGNLLFTSKKEAKLFFEKQGCEWIIDYFDKDLNIKYNKFYTTYFDFVSNIVQYKIPFYLTFYLAIFNLYLKKEDITEYSDEDSKEKELMLLFEEGSLALDFKELSDFGIPMLTLNKLKNSEISNEELKSSYLNLDILDSYEKMMLNDYYSLMQ